MRGEGESGSGGRLAGMSTDEGSPRKTTLNPRQKQFCRLYLAHGNASEAYRDAGYSETGANAGATRQLAKVHIQAELTRLRSITVRDSQTTRAFVLNRLYQFAEHAEPDSAAIRATELLGRIEGMFVELSESHVVHDVAALREYTPAQLRTMLAEATKQQALTEPVDSSD